MGVFDKAGEFLFGGQKAQTADLLSPEQKEYQNFLMGQSQGLAGMNMDSSYAGGYADQAYGAMQNSLRGQMNQALAGNQHTSRFHSSQQGYRNANIRNQFSQTMTNLAYQHATQQQDWMQQYAQKAKDWNYGGKYQAMAMLSDPALKNQTENYMTQGTGLMDIFNAASSIGSTISGMAGSTPTGGSMSSGAKKSF